MTTTRALFLSTTVQLDAAHTRYLFFSHSPLLNFDPFSLPNSLNSLLPPSNITPLTITTGSRFGTQSILHPPRLTRLTIPHSTLSPPNTIIMPGGKRSASGTPSPTNNMDHPQSEHSATSEYDPSPEPDIKPKIKSKAKAPAEGKVKVKAEPKQTSSPRKTLKTSAEAASPDSPTGATGADGRRLLVKAVIERGIASAMADSKVVMVEVSRRPLQSTSTRGVW